jgi:DNA-binding NtrC family response regulator
LVVDDEVTARTTLAELLREEGYEVEMAADAFKALGKVESFEPDVVLTDLQMPGMDGLELVRRTRTVNEPPAVIVMTAFGAVPSAVEAMRVGATDYLTKPLDFDALVAVLARTFENRPLRADQQRPTARVRNLVGETPAMLRVFEAIELAASSRATVLVSGEPGTGKQAIAAAIHQASPLARRPLVKLSCTGLGAAQLEAELFGYERGAMPGLVGHREGRLVQAAGSTLFLDEVALLPLATQTKLLRFLEEHVVERIGGTEVVPTDARLVAATCRNLADEVAAGRFREDLYYRLRVVAIAVPPLRERAADLPKLAKLFVRKFAAANGKLLDGLTAEALEALGRYGWPGNVRELEHALESAVVRSKSGAIEARALPEEILAAKAPVHRAPRIPGSTLAEIERHAIVETMQATGGSTSRAAEILGISTRTVQYRMHQYHEAPRSDVDVVRKPDPSTE